MSIICNHWKNSGWNTTCKELHRNILVMSSLALHYRHSRIVIISIHGRTLCWIQLVSSLKCFTACKYYRMGITSIQRENTMLNKVWKKLVRTSLLQVLLKKWLYALENEHHFHSLKEYCAEHSLQVDCTLLQILWNPSLHALQNVYHFHSMEEHSPEQRVQVAFKEHLYYMCSLLHTFLHGLQYGYHFHSLK